jgi:hypothetical protein
MADVSRGVGGSDVLSRTRGGLQCDELQATGGLMFDEYTTDQLIELRSFCSDVVDASGKAPYTLKAKDVVLLIEHIDKELALRERQKAA